MLGSPPHTRGILSGDYGDQIVARFTPAYAGNTSQRVRVPVVRQVHPRIRGEYSIAKRGAPSAQGSPPHTRGIREEARSRGERSGFTPAYAGNTVMSTRLFEDKTTNLLAFHQPVYSRNILQMITQKLQFSNY